jgi:molybdopterin/thiamine biosynthesis adenylyltransferase
MRYSRQTRFDPIGAAGQVRLTAARVLLVGCGGLGTLIADMLVRAGVGTLRIADRDIVEESNLQRQCLFTTADAAAHLPKATAAADLLRAINPEVTIEPQVCDVTARNVRQLADGMDLILDGTDNFEARFLLNDTALALGIPWVYGAAAGSEGMCVPIIPGRTPCLLCLSEAMPPPGSAPACDTVGVISPILHIVAARQCALAMQILTEGWQPPATLVVDDVWQGTTRHIPVGTAPAADCPCCVQRQFPYLAAKQESLATPICGKQAIQISWAEPRAVDFEQLATKLRRAGEVETNRFVLRFSNEETTLTLFGDGRAVIEGTTESTRARELYAKYIG